MLQSMRSQRVRHDLVTEQQQWEPAVSHTELSSVLCDDLQEWDELRGESPRRRGYIYIYS